MNSSAGNLAAVTDRNGRQRQFGYDALDRVKHERGVKSDTDLSADDLQRIFLRTPKGQMVRLDTVARAEDVVGRFTRSMAGSAISGLATTSS